MSVFDIETPTTITFSTGPGAPLRVYKGKEIYHIQATTNRATSVKFPKAGRYHTNAEIIRAVDGVEIPKPVPIPKQDRYTNHLDCTVKYNPEMRQGPARIFWKEGKIEVGPMFYTLPLQFREFILWHEKAHCYYSDEIAADTWALNKFMGEGYNASQAFFALSDVIRHTPENLKRVEQIFNQTSNFYK